MIDLHCHCLPGLDDGSPDMDVSVDMLRIAAEDGIKTIVCSPHALDSVYDNNDVEAIAAAVEDLSRAAGEQGVDIRLLPGADVHVSPDIITLHKEKKLPTIAGTRYFLLEFPHNMVPQFIENVIYDWQMAGLVPILTHPERNTELMRDPFRIADFVARGVLMQVTADSLTGIWGADSEQVALNMLAMRCVHFIATDAHGNEWRKPILSAARERVAELFGAEPACALVDDNPARVLANEQVVVPDPILPQVERKKPWYRFWEK